MRLTVPRRLGFVFEENIEGPIVYLCALPDGPLTALAGSAAVIWLLAIEDHDDVVQAVAADFGVDAALVRDDVENFIASLVEAGLLERAP